MVETKSWTANHLHLLMVSLAGCSLVLLSTRMGAFTSIDSASYVEAARNLATTGFLGGSLAPPTQFPPLYSATLALAETLGVDALAFARYLGALLFGSAIFLAGLLVAQSAPARRRLPLLTCLWLATSVDLIQIYSSVLSEGLFVFFVLLWVYFLCRYLEEQQSGSFLLMAGAAALAALTRYIGVVTILAGIPALALLNQGTARQRARDVLRYIIMAAFPISVWLMRNHLLAGDPLKRPLGFHPPTPVDLHDVLDTLSRWAISHHVPLAARGAILGLTLTLVAAAALRAARVSPQPIWALLRRSPVPSVCAFYLAAYWLFLLLSITFADADISLMGRLLVPTYVPSLLIVVTLLAPQVGRDKPTRGAWRATAAALALLVCLHVAQGIYNVAKYRRDGIGFANSAWRQSTIVTTLRNVPPGTLIYTNGPSVLYLLVGRAGRVFPMKRNPMSLAISEDYPSRLEEMKTALNREKGLVVFWREMAFPYFPSDRELRTAIPLVLRAEDAAGVLYEAQ